MTALRLSFNLICDSLILSFPSACPFPLISYSFSQKSHLWECWPFGSGFMDFHCKHLNFPCRYSKSSVLQVSWNLLCRAMTQNKVLKKLRQADKVGIISQLRDDCVITQTNLPVLSLVVCGAATSRSPLPQRTRHL